MRKMIQNNQIAPKNMRASVSVKLVGVTGGHRGVERPA